MASKQKVETAYYLLEKIGEDLNPSEFTLEETVEEFGDNDGKIRIGSTSGPRYEISDLLGVLVEDGYLDEMSEGVFRVLRTIDVPEESEDRNPDDD